MLDTLVADRDISAILLASRHRSLNIIGSGRTDSQGLFSIPISGSFTSGQAIAIVPTSDPQTIYASIIVTDDGTLPNNGFLGIGLPQAVSTAATSTTFQGITDAAISTLSQQLR
jgi:hypothetical protein